MTDVNKINVVWCKQQAPHPLPVQLDWSSEDWDGNKAKARGQGSLMIFKFPKPEAHKLTLDLIDDIPIQKLMIETDRLEEKMIKASDTWIPPQEMEATGITPDMDSTKLDSIKDGDEGGLTEHELHLQREDEKYTLYLDTQKPEESDTELETDESKYPFHE